MRTTIISVTVHKDKLIELVLDYLCEEIRTELSPNDVKIETKSTQNYRSEWETADFRATITKKV